MQAPLAGYAPSPICDTCREPAVVHGGRGPLVRRAGHRRAQCRLCGRSAADWRCATATARRCAGRLAGSARTADDLGRAPRRAHREADGDRPVLTADDAPQLVAATQRRARSPRAAIARCPARRRAHAGARVAARGRGLPAVVVERRGTRGTWGSGFLVGVGAPSPPPSPHGARRGRGSSWPPRTLRFGRRGSRPCAPGAAPSTPSARSPTSALRSTCSGRYPKTRDSSARRAAERRATRLARDHSRPSRSGSRPSAARVRGGARAQGADVARAVRRPPRCRRPALARSSPIRQEWSVPHMRLVFAGHPRSPSRRSSVSRPGRTRSSGWTRPPAPLGRKRVLTPSPVAQAADELGVPVIEAARLDAGAPAIAALEPDLGVIVAYGGLVRDHCCRARTRLDQPALLALPGWRAPPRCSRRSSRATRSPGRPSSSWSPSSTRATSSRRARVPSARARPPASCSRRCAVSGADTAGVVDAIGSGHGVSTPGGRDRRSPRSSRSMTPARLGEPPQAVDARFRGVTPEPGAFTEVDGARLKVLEGRRVRRPPSSDRPGRVARTAGGSSSARQTARSNCSCVQPAGSPAMGAADWWRGLSVDEAGGPMSDDRRGRASDAATAPQRGRATAAALESALRQSPNRGRCASHPRASSPTRCSRRAHRRGLRQPAHAETHRALAPRPRRRRLRDRARLRHRCACRASTTPSSRSRWGVHRPHRSAGARASCASAPISCSRRGCRRTPRSTSRWGRARSGAAHPARRASSTRCCAPSSARSPDEWREHVEARGPPMGRARREARPPSRRSPKWIVRAAGAGCSPTTERGDELDALLAADNAAPRVQPRRASRFGCQPGLDDTRHAERVLADFGFTAGHPLALCRGIAGSRVGRAQARTAACRSSPRLHDPRGPVDAGRADWLDPLRRARASKTARSSPPRRSRPARCSPRTSSCPHAPSSVRGRVSPGCSIACASRGVNELDGRDGSTRQALGAEGGFDRIHARCALIGTARAPCAADPRRVGRKQPADVADLTRAAGRAARRRDPIAEVASADGPSPSEASRSPHTAEPFGTVRRLERHAGEVPQLDSRAAVGGRSRHPLDLAGQARETFGSSGRTGTAPTPCSSPCVERTRVTPYDPWRRWGPS